MEIEQCNTSKMELWAALAIKVAFIFYSVLGISASPGTNHSSTSGLTAFFPGPNTEIRVFWAMFAILPFSLDHSHNTNQVEDTGKPSINYKITSFFRIQYKHVDRLADLQTTPLSCSAPLSCFSIIRQPRCL